MAQKGPGGAKRFLILLRSMLKLDQEAGHIFYATALLILKNKLGADIEKDLQDLDAGPGRLYDLIVSKTSTKHNQTFIQLCGLVALRFNYARPRSVADLFLIGNPSLPGTGLSLEEYFFWVPADNDHHNRFAYCYRNTRDRIDTLEKDVRNLKDIQEDYESLKSENNRLAAQSEKLANELEDLSNTNKELLKKLNIEGTRVAALEGKIIQTKGEIKGRLKNNVLRFFNHIVEAAAEAPPRAALIRERVDLCKHYIEEEIKWLDGE